MADNNFAPSAIFKTGEKLVRYCEKKRSANYTGIHDFTVYTGILSPTFQSKYKHLNVLAKYLAYCIHNKRPEREKSVSQVGKETFPFEPHETDLIKHALDSKYMGWGKDQHPIVQRHLHLHDPLTIATEVPVWDDKTAGFIDVLRIHSNGSIEIADFKPNAKKDKKAAAQVKGYKDVLVKTLGVDPKRVFCTWFDHEHAFILKDL